MRSITDTGLVAASLVAAGMFALPFGASAEGDGTGVKPPSSGPKIEGGKKEHCEKERCDKKEGGKEHCERPGDKEPRGEDGEVKVPPKPPRPEGDRPDHDCERVRCFDQMDEGTRERLREVLGSIRERLDQGDTNLGDLDGAFKKLIEGKKLCPSVARRLRQELMEDCKQRRAERQREEGKKERVGPPEHKCKGPGCRVCREHKERLARLEQNRPPKHTCGGDGCKVCREFREIKERIERELRGRDHRCEGPKCRVCGHHGERPDGPRPPSGERPGDGTIGIPPGEGHGDGEQGGRPDREHGNNGVGNGEDPQPPGDPRVNDGAGTAPGQPGARPPRPAGAKPR